MNSFAIRDDAPFLEAEELRRDGIDVADFPKLKYSKKDVERAGEALAGKLIWTDENAPGILRTFQIANSWRDSHAYPMRRLRIEMVAHIRKRKLAGLTAARLKRMPSIRRKLVALSTVNLNQIQDLGGCRAILSSIADVNTLIDSLKSGSKHVFHNESDYIGRPKPDGYRCHHLIFKFAGGGEEAPFNGRRIELQIRTRLQHSWATAVEAVGLFRKEDMKAGQGSTEWLRLFQLMSSELALAEKCPELADAPSRQARVKEIKALERELMAVAALENLRQAVKFTDTYVMSPHLKPEYFLIRYDNVNRTVTVEPHTKAIVGTASYDDSEIYSAKMGDKGSNIVFIEADDIVNLKAMYPNYFGDVLLFARNLKEITKGKAAQEYSMAPQEAGPQLPKVVPDTGQAKTMARL